MRKLIARSVLAMLALAVFSSTASAVPIPIGQLFWDLSGPGGTGRFSVVNQTGPGNSQPPDFPVLTQLVFLNDMNLSVTFNNATNQNLGQGAMTSPDGGKSWDTGFFGPNVLPTLAILTGNISPTGPVTLGGAPWAGIWNISGAIFTGDGLGNPMNLGNGINPIADQDTVIVYVDGQRAANAVPEPATFVLLGAGVIGLVARRRIFARP